MYKFAIFIIIVYKRIKRLQKRVIHSIQYKLLIKNKNLVTKSFIFVDSVD